MAETPLRHWLLNKVPSWFRRHGPLRRFYWQDEDFEGVEQRVKDLKRELGWD